MRAMDSDVLLDEPFCDSRDRHGKIVSCNEGLER